MFGVESDKRYERRVVRSQITGAQLLTALIAEKLDRPISWVPRHLEMREFRKGKPAVVFLQRMNGAAPVIQISRSDGYALVRSFGDGNMEIPEGATIFALRK